MMREEIQTSCFAGAREFLREDQISAKAKIVRPDQCVVRSGFTEQPIQSSAEPLSQRGRSEMLFGKVTEGRLNEKLGRGGDALLKDAVPFWVRRFAAGERHPGDGADKRANDVWHGQLDHAAHATRAQMVMGNHEFHSGLTTFIAVGSPPQTLECADLSALSAGDLSPCKAEEDRPAFFLRPLNAARLW